MGATASPALMWGMLLRDEKVQKDLDLVDDQKTKLKEVQDKADKSRQKMQGAFNFGALRDLSDDERQAKMQEMRKKMESQVKELAALAEESKKEIENILLPQQIDRLKEIALQAQGVRALQDKDVQNQLGLTPDQLDKLKKINENAMEKMQSSRPDFRAMMNLNDDERQAKMDEMRAKMEETRKKGQEVLKQAENDAMGVLTAEQKDKFEKMKGAKIDLSQLMQGGMRGGARGNRTRPQGPKN